MFNFQCHHMNFAAFWELIVSFTYAEQIECAMHVNPKIVIISSHKQIVAGGCCFHTVVNPPICRCDRTWIIITLYRLMHMKSL